MTESLSDTSTIVLIGWIFTAVTGSMLLICSIIFLLRKCAKRGIMSPVIGGIIAHTDYGESRTTATFGARLVSCRMPCFSCCFLCKRCNKRDPDPLYKLSLLLRMTQGRSQ